MSSSPPTPCPRCGGPRRWEEVQGARVEACAQCGSVTLTRAELFALMGKPLPFQGLVGSPRALGGSRQTIIPAEDDATAEAVDEAPPAPSRFVPQAPPAPAVTAPVAPAAPPAPAPPPAPMPRPGPAPTILPEEETEPAEDVVAPEAVTASVAAASPAPDPADSRQPVALGSLGGGTWFDEDAAGMSPPTDEVPTTFVRNGDTEEVPRHFGARPEALEAAQDATQVSEGLNFAMDDALDDARDEPGLGALGELSPARSGRGETPFSSRQTVELEAWHAGGMQVDDDYQPPPKRFPWAAVAGLALFLVAGGVLAVAGLLGLGWWSGGATSAPAAPSLAEAVAAGREAPPATEDASRDDRIQVEGASSAPPSPAPVAAPATAEPASSASAAPAAPPSAPKAPPAAAAPAAPVATSAKARISQGWNVVGSDPAKAAGLFKAVLDEDASNADAHYGYGYAQLQRGQPEVALDHLCRASRTGNVEIQREVQGLLGRNDLTCP